MLNATARDFSPSQHTGPAKLAQLANGTDTHCSKQETGNGPPDPVGDSAAPPPQLFSLVSGRAQLWAAPRPRRGGRGGAGDGARLPREGEEPREGLRKTAKCNDGPGPPSPRRPPRPGVLVARLGHCVALLPPGCPAARRPVSYPPRPRPTRTVPYGKRRANG